MNSPALEALRKAAADKKLQTTSSRDIGKTNKIDTDTYGWCGKHHKHKKKGICAVCIIEQNHKKEMIRRDKAIIEGSEKWVNKTCFKKPRQSKKYVMKMMGLSGKQYRKLQIEAKRREKDESDRKVV